MKREEHCIIIIIIINFIFIQNSNPRAFSNYIEYLFDNDRVEWRDNNMKILEF